MNEVSRRGVSLRREGPSHEVVKKGGFWLPGGSVCLWLIDG